MACHRFRYRSGAAAQSRTYRRRDRARCRRARTIRSRHHHEPADAASAARDGAAHRESEIAAPRDRGNLHLRDRRTRKMPNAFCAKPAMSCSTARSAEPARRPATKDIVIYASGDRAAIRKLNRFVRGFFPRRARSRRLRQRQPDEICRQPPGRDPQCGDRRSDGARHESRPRALSKFCVWFRAASEIHGSSNCARR